ncbi:hypothetical protein Tco_0487640 [Tanacetum coccineum]
MYPIYNKGFLDLEHYQRAHSSNEIASLKRWVKMLEHENKRSRTHGFKRSYKDGSSRRVESSDEEDVFGVMTLDGDEVIVDNEYVVKTAEETVNAAATTISTASTIPISAAITTTTTITTVSDVEITLAQALTKLKSAKPKTDKVVIQGPEQGTTTTTTNAATTITAASTRPKDKGIVIHEQEQAPTPTVSSQKPS